MHAADGRSSDSLDVLLASAHGQVGIAVHDRLMAQGGVPELRDPDLALDRLLAAAHRTAGRAITARLSQATHVDPADKGGQEAPRPDNGALASRPAPVRLKYRRDAMQIARAYWPRDLVDALRTALRLLERLSEMLEASQQPADRAREVVEQLDARFAEVLLLPAPRRRPVELTGTDYLAAVEVRLARPAEQLFYDVERVRQVMDEEFAPLFTAIDDAAAGYLLGAEAVAQDLYDDLEHASTRAMALSRAVAEVEKISNDFVGADLRHANLDGVLLEGIRWDAATIWPDGWEALIRRASLPVGGEHGVLVIAAEPDDSVIPAKA
ncbi:hypothetical protein [Streptomyces sp. Rer75]|uniref:hypothetical protein n=1 Tax=Streptomyces sp. Rer75 TaxID=2750011 RepID=UPI00211E77AF|nr:hypothetical protein [Streptomyces sp. Rer75]